WPSDGSGAAVSGSTSGDDRKLAASPMATPAVARPDNAVTEEPFRAGGTERPDEENRCQRLRSPPFPAFCSDTGFSWQPRQG
ncbi:MAG: hypothetical protein R3324_21065, partial [Halobacteriales archaeon]|nr:hypothetical protein [Halobacteriales archaeon]